MPAATFRFHAELNDFLPQGRRDEILRVEFNGHETVKHLLESLGAPHTEVDVILVNGKSVSFDHRPEQGDHVEVFPVQAEVHVDSLIHLQAKSFPVPQFVLDGHLGKLAAYLRLLGFDAWYRNDAEDGELAQVSSGENRILLTRDRGLLKRSQVIHGYCVREKSPRKQLVEVFGRFDLAEFADPFTRCVHCNGLLKPVQKEAVLERLEPKTRLYYDDFSICEDCEQIYWKGSHFERMEKFITEMVKTRAGRIGFIEYGGK